MALQQPRGTADDSVSSVRRPGRDGGHAVREGRPFGGEVLLTRTPDELAALPAMTIIAGAGDATPSRCRIGTH
jgi:hypothetical protein